MYVNKCIKCGAEFETKNPKRVICPNCLYADKGAEDNSEEKKTYSSYSSYSAGDDRNERPRQFNNRSGYNRDNSRSYNNNRRFDNNRNDNNGGYQQRRNFGNYGGGMPSRNNNNSGNNRFGGGQRRPNNRFQQQGNRRPRPQMKKQAKPLLISKEQLEQIEVLYKTMLPLPNPDAHEVIGTHLGIEPRKVFFGINLVRQKLMLPKLQFPKRKLAVTPDQMTAIKSLYTPLLPLPPIGCHKIIAAQLRVDEWRVHVAIKLIRAQMGLDRWNEDRPDKPADYLTPKYPAQEEALKKAEAAKENADTESEEVKPKRGRKKSDEVEQEAVQEASDSAVEEKPKRGRKKKEESSDDVSSEPADSEEKPKRGRKKKADDEAVAEEDSVEDKPKKRGRKKKEDVE